MSSKTYSFRVILIGDSCVGKTSILRRFLSGQFDNDEPSSVGSLYHSYTENKGHFSLELALWDTAGQEQYQSISSIYFRGSDAALIVFDLTNRSSFEGVSRWYQTLTDTIHLGKNFILYIIGNKSDLSQERIITSEEAKQLASSLNAYYTETSALNNSGIPILFPQIINKFETMVLTSSDEQFLERHLKIQDEPTSYYSCC